MGRLKELKSFVKIFTVLIVVFFLSMVLVYCIPTSWIQANVEASVALMEDEGNYPMYFFYRHNSIMDVQTDKLMYQSLITNRPEEYNAVEASVSINQYPRYWHGYQVLLRPLSIIFQIQEVRYLGMLTFHLLLFGSAWMIAKKTKLSIALIYILTICTGNIALSSVCLQFMTTFFVLFTSLIVLLCYYDKEKALDAMKFFFIVGMIENFFDFLTFPIITLGIPLILLIWLRVRDEQADFKSNFCFMFKGSVSWGLGYALTWVMKWLIATVILGVRYFWRTMDVVKFRLEGNEEYPLDRIGTIQKNLKSWLNIQDHGMISWSKVVILIMVVALILIIWKKLKDRKTISAYVPILFVALYPYVWYLVMSNHSQIHHWYTYRAQLVVLFGGLVFLASILKENHTKR